MQPDVSAFLYRYNCVVIDLWNGTNHRDVLTHTVRGLTPATSAPGLRRCVGSPLAASAPGLGSPLPHLHRDWAHPVVRAHARGVRARHCLRTRERRHATSRRMQRLVARRCMRRCSMQCAECATLHASSIACNTHRAAAGLRRSSSTFATNCSPTTQRLPSSTSSGDVSDICRGTGLTPPTSAPGTDPTSAGGLG